MKAPRKLLSELAWAASAGHLDKDLAAAIVREGERRQTVQDGRAGSVGASASAAAEAAGAAAASGDMKGGDGQ